MNQRNTFQRTVTLDAVHTLANHPTADDVYNFVHEKYPQISRTTVYRNLNKLCDSNDLLNQMGWDIIQEEDKSKKDLSDIQKSIMEIIAIEERTFDEIAQITKFNVADLMVSLTELELKSLIKQTNNKYYIM